VSSVTTSSWYVTKSHFTSSSCCTISTLLATLPPYAPSLLHCHLINPPCCTATLCTLLATLPPYAPPLLHCHHFAPSLLHCHLTHPPCYTATLCTLLATLPPFCTLWYLTHHTSIHHTSITHPSRIHPTSITHPSHIHISPSEHASLGQALIRPGSWAHSWPLPHTQHVPLPTAVAWALHK